MSLSWVHSFVCIWLNVLVLCRWAHTLATYSSRTLFMCYTTLERLYFIYFLRDWFSHRLFNIAAPVTVVDVCSILIFNPDQAAYYHILPANHHSTIALYSSIVLTRQHIITFSLLITIPPLLCTHL